MTELAALNVRALVTRVNAQNTEGLRKFLPLYAEWKRNAAIYAACIPPINPGPAPLGPPIGIVNQAAAGAKYEAWETDVELRGGITAMPDDEQEPDYSDCITYKQYVPATDAKKPAMNTDPLPPGDEIETEPGSYYVQPGDHAPAGTPSVGTDGRTYVKIGHSNPFGTSYRYRPLAA